MNRTWGNVLVGAAAMWLATPEEFQSYSKSRTIFRRLAFGLPVATASTLSHQTGELADFLLPKLPSLHGLDGPTFHSVVSKSSSAYAWIVFVLSIGTIFFSATRRWAFAHAERRLRGMFQLESNVPVLSYYVLRANSEILWGGGALILLGYSAPWILENAKELPRFIEKYGTFVIVAGILYAILSEVRPRIERSERSYIFPGGVWLSIVLDLLVFVSLGAVLFFLPSIVALLS